MTTAYSYTRVSTSSQDKDGRTGLQRQQDSIREFLKQYPQYTLSDKTYSDKASGYHGMNIKDDAGLGQFLNDCDKGLVQAGDMLCVELVDRISRLPPDDARELFKRILSYGVKVAIVRWGIVIDKAENKLDLAGDLLLTVGFHLAHMESEQKSKRVQSAKDRNVQKARDKGTILFTGNSAPRWLEVNEDKTAFIVKPKEAEQIKRIFEMKLSGLGANKIMTKLESEGNLMLGGKLLRTDSVTRLLKNRRLIGEWQPQHRKTINGKRVYIDNGEPIQNYYPSIVSKELFEAVQASFQHTAKGKASRSFNNVFNGLMKCSSCGYTYTQKVSYSKGKVYRIYYSCTGNSHRKVCKRTSIHMNPVRDSLIKALSVLDYERIQDNDINKQMGIQRGVIENDIKELEKSISKLALAIEVAETADQIKDIMARDSEKRLELNAKETELSALNNSMRQAGADELKKAVDIDLEDEENRIKLNNLFKQHISKITLFASGIANIHFKVGYKDIKQISVNTKLTENDLGFIQYLDEEEELSLANVLKAYDGDISQHLMNQLEMLLAGNDTIEEAYAEAERIANTDGLSPLMLTVLRHHMALN